MSTSYALLLGLVLFIALFIYFVLFSVSLRLEKDENKAEIAVKRKSVPFRWKDLIDPKNKKLGFIHIFLHAKYELNPTDPSRVMTRNGFNIILSIFENCTKNASAQ